MLDGPLDAAPSAWEVALAALGTGFETGGAGWTHASMDGVSAPSWPLDEWQLGTATSGPNSCHTGMACWATRLDANYTSCERAELVSPPLDLSACTGTAVTLSVWSWHDFWTGTVAGKSGTWFDGGFVELASGSGAWQTASPTPAYPGVLAINGNINSFQCVSPTSFYADGRSGLLRSSAGWQELRIPIPAALVTAAFKLRVVYATGVSYPDNDAEGNRAHTRPGWYLDDLAFHAE